MATGVLICQCVVALSSGIMAYHISNFCGMSESADTNLAFHVESYFTTWVNGPLHYHAFIDTL